MLGLEQIGEDVSAVKWRLADLLEMLVCDASTSASCARVIEPCRSLAQLGKPLIFNPATRAGYGIALKSQVYVVQLIIVDLTTPA